MTVVREPQEDQPISEEATVSSAVRQLLDPWVDLPALITVQEAADLLGVSRSTAYRAAERGELPVIRLGGRMRVPVARLLALTGLLHPTPGTADDR